MGSFLQGLGILAGAAGDALVGYGIDKRERFKTALAQAEQERAQQALSLSERVGASNIAQNDASIKALLAAKPRRTPAQFMSKGVATQGSMDEAGTYFGADNNPVTDATVYEKPEIPWQEKVDFTARTNAKYNPLPTPQLREGVTPTGAPGVFAVDPVNATSKQVGGMSPSPTKVGLARALGGLGQSYEARILTAMNEAPFILNKLNEYERSHMVGGKFRMPYGAPAAAQIQAGAQSSDVIKSTMQEIAGRVGDPATNQYFANAARIARLMQLISARGGSEAMVGQESRLFRGQSQDSEAAMETARNTREAMVGKFGAVMQTLSPEQKRKLALGISAIMEGKGQLDFGNDETMSYTDLSNDIFNVPTSGSLTTDPNLTRLRELWDEATPAERQKMGPRRP